MCNVEESLKEKSKGSKSSDVYVLGNGRKGGRRSKIKAVHATATIIAIQGEFALFFHASIRLVTIQSIGVWPQ